MLPTGRRLSYRDITPELEIELARRCQAGDKAAGGVLVTANEPMIYKFVRRYLNKGVRTEDIMQAARLGFFRGILRFDPSEGARLTTYALHWARNEAINALQVEGPTIRLPQHLHDAMYQAARAGETLDDDRAEAIRLLRTPSLDVPVGRDGSTRGDLSVSEALSPEALLADDESKARSKELVERALTWLNPQERDIVERHLLAEEPECYEAIGKSFGFTKQRAQQVLESAMPKLERALRRVLAQDDAVLWGGDLPAGPMRPRRPAARRAPTAEPAPASGVVAAPRRRAKTVVMRPAANDAVSPWESASR
jgi:RNA polymerase sigma factor (sigma-70 family)